MSSLTAQQTSNDGSAKAFIITQAASRFENIALQYLKLQEPDTSEETIQSNEIKNKLSSYKELIQAANNEMEHKMHLLEIQKDSKYSAQMKNLKNFSIILIRVIKMFLFV